MSRLVVVTLIVFAFLVALPAPATAQDHDHAAGGEGLLLIADTPADGRTRVGDVTHFSYVILDDETNDPQPHNDVHVRVTLDDIELYQTESAHDYDGVGGFSLVFPTTGAYNVTVTVPGEPDRVAHFEGHVVPMTAPVEARLVLEEAPTEARAGEPVRFTYRVDGPDGAIIPHSDALVEVRRLSDDFPVLQVHTHTHDEPMSFSYAFERSGPHLVRITGYTAFPSEDATEFLPMTQTHLVDVTGESAPTADLRHADAGAGTLPGTPTAENDPADATGPTSSGPDPAAAERRHAITADPVAGTSMIAGPFSQVRMSTVAFEGDPQRLLQHTDHTATLTGPYGPVFHSDSLHEYDGVLEIMSANQMVGDYTWKVGVPGTDTPVALTYQVLPANAPAFGVGPQFIDVDGLDRLTAGQAGDVGFFVHDAAGLPFQHGEVALRLDDDAGVPLLQHKLHTHASGMFHFTYTPPMPGGYLLQVDPFDVHGAPTPRYHGSALGEERALAFSVTSGSSLRPAPMEATGTIHESTPGPVLPLVLLGVVLGAWSMTRRRTC